MKILDYSSRSAVIEISTKQIEICAMALSELLDMGVDETEIRTVMYLSHEAVKKLKKKIDSSLSMCNQTEKRLTIELLYADMLALRGLLVDAFYHAYFPRFPCFSDSEKQQIKALIDSFTFDVIPKMEKGTMLQIKQEKYIKACNELELRGLRGKMKKASRVKKHRQRGLNVTLGEVCFDFRLTRESQKNLSFQVDLSIINDANRDFCASSSPQFISLRNIILFMTNLEFFSTFDGSSKDIELPESYCLSLRNSDRENALSITFYPSSIRKMPDREKIDLTLHFNPSHWKTDSSGLYFNTAIEPQEILKFTASIRGLFSLI